VQGSGPDIWGSADELHFSYRTLTGDGSITARVASLTHSNSWAKAAVMIRAGLGTGASEVSLVVSVGNGLAFLRRTTTGGSTAYTSAGTGAAPQWVRLTRSGNSVSAHRSADGTSWTAVGSQSISLPSTVYIGLAVTTATPSGLATATFSGVTVP
jgi:regulation of enolase protein 1 (concanavalin A-like superfamily)